MWQHSSGLGPLAVLSLSFCVRQCAGALQVTTNITGSEIDFKERLLIEWSGDSQSSHDVGVQQQSASENGSFVLLSGGNTDSSLDWDFGYDFDVGTYAFVVRTTGSDDGEAQSPLYTLLDPHLTTSSVSSSATSSPSSSSLSTSVTPTSSPSTTASTTTSTAAVNSDVGNDASLSTGAAIGVGVGVGIVGVVLLGVLLMWMYRRGKKAAAAGHANKDLKQDRGYADHWVGGANTASPGFAPSPRLEVAGGGSRDDYSELQNTPVYSELGGAQRSELCSEYVTKAELPSDAEVRRAGGRRW